MLPDKPLGPFRLGPLKVSRGPQTISSRVNDIGDRWELVMKLGKIQPSATVWSKPFWIGSTKPMELSLEARVFADNFARQIAIPISIGIDTETGYFKDSYDDEEED